jgi:hypothetical protein
MNGPDLGGWVTGDDLVRERLHSAAQKIGGFNNWTLGKKFFQLKRWNLSQDLGKLLAANEFEEALEKIAQKIEDAMLSGNGISGHRQLLREAGFLK